MREQMSGGKIYSIFLCTLFAIILLIYCIPTVLPIVGRDKYYEEKTVIDKNISYIVIHDSNECPLSDGAWFSVKSAKYDILIKENASICQECIDEDEARKLLMIHNFNLHNLMLRYSLHYTEEEIQELMSKYNCNATLNNAYHLE